MSVECQHQLWRRLLHITKPGFIEAIDPDQVTLADGAHGYHDFVGVVNGPDAYTIYHARPLTQSDIVHELLHVAQPLWDEHTVVHASDIIEAYVDTWQLGVV